MEVLWAPPRLVDDDPERWVVSESVSWRLNESVPEDVWVVVALPPDIVALEPMVTVSTLESVPVDDDESLVVNVEVGRLDDLVSPPSRFTLILQREFQNNPQTNDREPTRSPTHCDTR